jgi:hypothetical protein
MGKDTSFYYGFNEQPDYRTHDPPTYACTGLVECIVCHRVHGHCDELTRIPYGNSQPSATEKGSDNVNVGQHVKSSGQGDRNPFIQPEDVSKKGSTFTVVGAREVNSPAHPRTKDKKASNGFFGLMLDIKNGTKKYCLPVRYDRFDLAKLCKQMKSEDTDDWLGKKVKLVRVNGSQGGQFVNVA